MMQELGPQGRGAPRPFETTGTLPGQDLPVVNAPYRFWTGLGTDLRSMVEQRELLRSLIARELRQRYKGSVLGWGWALVRPLVMLLVYGVAIGVFLGANASVPDFAIYLYSGLLGWTFFATILSGSVLSLPQNSDLISKAKFQKELLVIAVLVVALFDLLIQSSILLIGYVWMGDWPHWQNLHWLVWGILLLGVLGLALGLLLSAANVYFRDVGYLTEVLLQIGFWTVPIVYTYATVAKSLAAFPVLVSAFAANPLTAALTSFRLALWPPADGPVGSSLILPETTLPWLLGFSVVGSLVVLWLAQRFFARISGNMAQEL